MTSLFEVLASHDAEEQERLTGTRAAIAAQTRAKARFEGFLAKADSDIEREARLALIDSNLRTLAAEAAEEYDADPEKTYLAATVALGGGHASDCSCGFCENKGNLPGQSKDEDGDGEDDDLEKESKTTCSSVKTACAHCSCNDSDCDCSEDSPCGHDGCKFSKEAKLAKLAKWVVADGASPPDGDNYQSERVDLPSNDDDGLGSEGSPKIDKSNSGDEKGWNTEVIDVGSVRHRNEHQEVGQGWTAEVDERSAHDRVVIKQDHLNKPLDLDSPLIKDIDVTKSVGPQDGGRTKTFPSQPNQASPVTSTISKWQVVE